MRDNKQEIVKKPYLSICEEEVKYFQIDTKIGEFYIIGEMHGTKRTRELYEENVVPKIGEGKEWVFFLEGALRYISSKVLDLEDEYIKRRKDIEIEKLNLEQIDLAKEKDILVLEAIYPPSNKHTIEYAINEGVDPFNAYLNGIFTPILMYKDQKRAMERAYEKGRIYGLTDLQIDAIFNRFESLPTLEKAKELISYVDKEMLWYSNMLSAMNIAQAIAKLPKDVDKFFFQMGQGHLPALFFLNEFSKEE